MKLIKSRKVIALAITFCMVLGILIIPQFENVYAVESSGLQTKIVSIRVEGPTANIVYDPAFRVVGTGPDQLTVGDALAQVLDAAGKTYTRKTDGYFSVIEGVSEQSHGWDGWLYFLNDLVPPVGMEAQIISDGDEIVVFYGYYPGFGTDKVTLHSTLSRANVTLTIKNGEAVVSGVAIYWNESLLPVLTDEQGQVVIENIVPGTYPVQIAKSDEYGVPQVVRFPAATTITITAADEISSPSAIDFTDVSKEAWYAEAVNRVLDLGLFKGVSEKRFAPELTMNREMFVTVLGRMHEMKHTITPSKKSIFGYILTDAYYKNYLEWAFENNIFSGLGDGKFDLQVPVTREQMVVFMYRYFSFMGLVENKTSNTLASFSDGSDVSSWAVQAMEWALDQGLLTGKTKNTLDPSGFSTRAEVAIFTVRCFNSIYENLI